MDHRLVRDRHIEHLSHRAATLYLFLVTVADAQGISYYSDPSVSKRLSMDINGLRQARHDLIRLELIAYKKPLYQVLALQSPEPTLALSGKRAAGPQSIGEILKQIMEDVR